MTAPADAQVETFQQILEASSLLDELPDAARMQAWASSVLGVWGEAPDAAAIDSEFLAWLSASDDPRSVRVRSLLAELMTNEVSDAEPPVATRAWSLVGRGDASVGIGFQMHDGSEHSLLGDIVDGALTSLVLAPGPDELFDGAEDIVAPTELDPEVAAAQMVAAWRVLVNGGADTPESVYVNGAIAQHHLGALTETDLRSLFRPDAEVAAFVDSMDPSDRADFDRWALSVLDSAGVGLGEVGDQVLLDVLDPARTETYPRTEQEAFGALEWADWLGVVIGLSRLSAGVQVEPTMLVDQINQCPEVTSTIPKKDRGYYEWAFSLVIPLWRQGRVLDSDNRLTGAGSANLVAALRSAWGPGR